MERSSDSESARTSSSTRVRLVGRRERVGAKRFPCCRVRVEAELALERREVCDACGRRDALAVAVVVKGSGGSLDVGGIFGVAGGLLSWVYVDVERKTWDGI